MKLDLDDFCEVLPMSHRYTTYVAGLCPFHESDPPRASVLVFDDGRYLCLSCGKKGFHAELYDAASKMPRIFIQEAAYIPPTMPKNQTQLDDLVTNAHERLRINLNRYGWYLRERKVDIMVDTAFLGWYEDWYTIPIFENEDIGGEIRGVVFRASPMVQRQSGMRFIQPPGQKSMLYVPEYQLSRAAKRLFVVFGMFDALSLAALRLFVCTSTGGKDSFDPEWLNWWRRSIVIVPDDGEEDSANELACAINGNRAAMHRLSYPRGCKDPNDILVKKGEKALFAALSPWV